MWCFCVKATRKEKNDVVSAHWPSSLLIFLSISFHFIVNLNLPLPSSSFSSYLPFLLHLPTTLIATGAAQTLEAAGQQVLFPALAPRSFGFEQPDFVIASSGVRQKLLLVSTFEQLDEYRLFVVAFSSSCANGGAAVVVGGDWCLKDVVGKCQHLCG